MTSYSSFFSLSGSEVPVCRKILEIWRDVVETNEPESGYEKRVVKQTLNTISSLLQSTYAEDGSDSPEITGNLGFPDIRSLEKAIKEHHNQLLAGVGSASYDTRILKIVIEKMTALTMTSTYISSRD